MPKPKKHSQNETQGVLLRPLEESEKIDDVLLTLATRVGKPLSQARMEQLQRDLAPYPVEGIEWALDTWGRNSKALPALSDLRQMLSTWLQPQGTTCECKALHWTGYGINDVMWLLKKRMAAQEEGIKWSIAQWEAHFAELDSKREGGAPAWRKTPEGHNFLRTPDAA